MIKKELKFKGRFWGGKRDADGVVDPETFYHRYENLEANLENTALLVVDVYGKGYDEGDPIPKNPVFSTKEHFFIEKDIILNKIKPVLDEARQKKMKIIFVENRGDPYLADENSEYGKTVKRLTDVSVQEYFGKRDFDTKKREMLEYSKILEPKEGEFVSKKRFYDGFTGTELDYLLRNLGVKNLICIGFATDICLFFTIYRAWTLNYKIILIRDATLGWELFGESIKELDITKKAIWFIERLFGHTILTEDFLKACKLL